MEIKISNATIVLSPGADLVSLFTDLPTPMPYVTDQPAILTFNVEYDKGEAYLLKNFPGIYYNVISRPIERKI